MRIVNHNPSVEPGDKEMETGDYSVTLELDDGYKLTVWHDGGYMLSQRVGEETHSKSVARGSRGELMKHLELGKRQSRIDLEE